MSEKVTLQDIVVNTTIKKVTIMKYSRNCKKKSAIMRISHIVRYSGSCENIVTVLKYKVAITRKSGYYKKKVTIVKNNVIITFEFV